MSSGVNPTPSSLWRSGGGGLEAIIFRCRCRVVLTHPHRPFGGVPFLIGLGGGGPDARISLCRAPLMSSFSADVDCVNPTPIVRLPESRGGIGLER
jgi:hypothetical protein